MKSSVQMIPVKSIVITPGRRVPEQIESLADSIRELGLLNAITVTTDRTLVAGGRRLAACKSLKWTEIPANVVALDGLQAELAEIDENLMRAELTVLERSEQLKRRKEIYEILHPETQHVTVRGGPGRPAKPSSGTASVKTAPNKSKGPIKTNADSASVSYLADVAAKTNVSVRTAQVEVQIAEEITDEVKSIIRGTPLEDRKTDLLKLAQVKDKEEQKKLVEIITKSPEPITVSQAKVERHRQERREELKEKEKVAVAAASASDAPSPWQVITGDVCDTLRSLPVTPRLIFADPPYNVGIDYGQGEAADMLPATDFTTWLETWIKLCREKIAPDGSFWLLISDEFAAEACIIAKRYFTLRNWIIWYETFGVNCSGKFNRTKRHLFYCVVDPKKFVFNPDAVTRQSARQVLYNDARAMPGGKLWDDLWAIPRLTGTAAERLPDFPTQLPLDLLRPIVKCCSDPGDMVLDPFNGSGTTGAASIESNRRYIGIEKSATFADSARSRLRSIIPLKGE